MKKRKYVRIALSHDDGLSFVKAKAKAEQSAGITLSDGGFALGLIRKAIDGKK